MYNQSMTSADNTAEPNTQTLAGSIERVVFHNPDNGFAVLRVKTQNRRDMITIVGFLPSATAGEHVEASGQWIMDKDYGQQFKAETLHTTHPATREGITKYLASGFIKGIGPHFAKMLVHTFGEHVFEIIEKQPERLKEIRGLGVTRIERIKKNWRDQRVIREIMVFLQGHGLGVARAVRIHKTYGDDAIGIVKQNPYRLAYDIKGIGFPTADGLAMRLGVDPYSPQRAQAGVGYALHQLTTQGHCAFPEDGLVNKAMELLDIDEPIIRSAIDHEIGEGRLVRDQIGEDTCIYLASLHHAETQLAARVRKLATGRHPLPALNMEETLEWVQKQVGLQLAQAQLAAVAQATTSKVLIITGGPGVGKTTIVNSILKIFTAKKLNCVLCAPTGRAAKRMTEATSYEAKTIHRLLEFDPNTWTFTRNAQNRLHADLVLVDEVSMMDLPLAWALIQAVPDNAALILVGDVDQLPSVGPGVVLADMIASGAVSTVRLTEVFRQAAESQIIQAAYNVNNGRMPDLQPPTSPGDFYFFHVDDPAEALNQIVELVTVRIPRRFGFDPINDIQVLTPMHKGDLGARNLNQALQAKLNPPQEDKPEVELLGYTYRVGDKVLQTENDYQKEVFNGDLGVITTVDAEEKELSVDFDGRAVVYDFAELDELVPAYAMSIHKSQGSEFPAVVIPVHTQHYIMLQRNLLYTGITRGKRLVVLVGMSKAVEIAVRRADAVQRYSALRYRLSGRL